MEGILFAAQDIDYGNSVDVLIYKQVSVYDRMIVPPLTLNMVEHKRETVILDPTLRLSHDSARSLMDALWNSGIRPTEAKYPAGELNRMNDHLQDMRKLVFERRKGE